MAFSPRKSGSLSIAVPDIDRKIAAFKVLMPKAFDRGLYAGIWAATIEVQERVKNLIDGPVLNRRSGRLWRSIHNEVFRKGGVIVGIVGTDVKYAAIHEFGGTIRPKKAGGFLVFKNADGETAFAREVKIPKRPYMSKGLEDSKSAINKHIERHIMKAVNDTLKGMPAKPAGERSGRSSNAD